MRILNKVLIVLGVTSMLFAVIPTEEVGASLDAQVGKSCYKSCESTSKSFYRGIELSEEQEAKVKEICEKYIEELNSLLTVEQLTQIEAQNAEAKPAVEATEIKVAEPEVKEEAATDIEVNVSAPSQQVI
ncbi:MAG: hypothetical protein WCH76_03845 [Candidatus Riflemargulisbacteria bacterium]